MADDAIPELKEDDLQAIAQWVFINTMVDLELRIEHPSFAGHRYHMLGIAALLRKLLIDGGTLVGRVNRRYKLDLKFNIVPYERSDLDCHNMLRSHADGQEIPRLKDIPYWRIFEPGSLIPTEENPGKELSLAHFLNTTVGIIKGHRLTAKELIKFYCIVEGGVHIGDPRNQYEKDLLRTAPGELLQPMHGVNGSPIGTLHPLAQITKQALLPLMQAINDDPATLTELPGFRVSMFGKTPWEVWRGGPELNRKS